MHPTDPSPIFTDWQPANATAWGREPQCLEHSWHTDSLFGLDTLAELIERYPSSACALVRTSSRGEARRWHEGELGGLSGAEVIATIARGGMWLNLRDVQSVDPRYARLLEAAHAELARRMPGFAPGALRMGILISSPSAQVPFHADLPGQALWQITGAKRVYLYPPRPPFLPPEALENIALTALEVGMPYDSAFDDGATVVELRPGQMLHWPLNSPHRIDNHDMLNVSVTTEYWTPEIRRSQMVTLANGVLRRHFGWRSGGRAMSGPSFWAKAALQSAWRRSPWARRQRRQARPVDFRLDRAAPEGWIALPPGHRPS